MAKIKCSVSNCKFFDNLLCQAKAIEVNCDDDSFHTNQKEDTHCETFRAKQ